MHGFKMYKELFLGFFRAGMLGYGGGPASIPLIHKEVVETYKWMTDEEFSDCLALGNTLPGPIATKISGYIGFKVAGALGLLTAILATIIPTVVIMLIVVGFLASLRDSPIVQGMTKAVAPVVGVMLLILAYNFLKQSGDSLGWSISLFLGVLSLIGYWYLNIHPAIIIGSLILYTLVPKNKDKSLDKKKLEGD